MSQVMKWIRNLTTGPNRVELWAGISMFVVALLIISSIL